jgi:hypothetical protein
MKLLLFDLENTLIQHWTDRSLCWVESNKEFLSLSQPDVIGIFSFALHCQENVDEFVGGGMKEEIEIMYDIEISEDYIIPVSEMFAASFNFRKLENGTNDQKIYTFLDWCDSNQEQLSKFEEVWLVDDTIENSELNHFSFKIICKNPVVIQDFI